MTIETLTGSTARASLLARHAWRAGAGSRAEARLGVRGGGPTPRGAGQLAHDSLVAGGRTGIPVDLLAGQRGAPAVGATAAIGLQRTETAAQQDQLELFNVRGDRCHGRFGFRCPGGGSFLDMLSCRQTLRAARSRRAGGVGGRLRRWALKDRQTVCEMLTRRTSAGIDSLAIISTSFPRRGGLPLRA